MFEFDDIKRLTAEDIKMLHRLYPFLKEAENAEKMIRETYLFHFRDKKITLIDEENYYESISNDGEWSASYNGKDFNISCSSEVIFEVFKTKWMLEENGSNTNNNEISFIIGRFNSFLMRTSSIYEQGKTVTS